MGFLQLLLTRTTHVRRATTSLEDGYKRARQRQTRKERRKKEKETETERRECNIQFFRHITGEQAALGRTKRSEPSRMHFLDVSALLSRTGNSVVRITYQQNQMHLKNIFRQVVGRLVGFLHPWSRAN
jgi:hypothetical protein